jgi:3D-(3,5/4)-trihydroxycyclohexane-1,2-dione acylhydrolase (decyclizing)
VAGGDTLDTLRAALEEASAHDGLSVVHVPVYAGTAADGGLGTYGSWNVGNWCTDVQARYSQTDI